MKSILFLLTGLILLGYYQTNAQGIDKKAGVCFRVDDDQPPAKLRAFDSVFRKNGVHFTYGVNAQRANRVQPADYWPTVKMLQDNGNEIADHSPNHYSMYFEVTSAKDTTSYSGRKGVHHISTTNITFSNGPRICLDYTIRNSSGSGDEGMVNIDGDKMISVNNGEFADSRIYGPAFYTHFYIPSLNLVLGYTSLINKNSSDPDTVLITSFWNETINFGTHTNLSFKKLTSYDVEIDADGFKLMQEFSLAIFRKNGIKEPTVWIQPGGKMPYMSKEFIADVLGREYGFTSAATYPGTIKGFNENDEHHNKKFHMQWGDITEENQSVQQMKDIIADRHARHVATFGLNHFANFGAGFAFDVILSHVDSLIMWCQDKGIPVLTYSEWGSVLYDSITKRSYNIFPSPAKDLNEDGKPDGYYMPDTYVDTSQGAPGSNNRSFTSSTTKTIFSVKRLSGAEPGKNTLKVWLKGGTGNFFRISINYPEINTYEVFDILAYDTIFTQHTRTFNVPQGINLVNITGTAYITNSSYPVSASGIEWRGVAYPSIKSRTFIRQANQLIPDINLNTCSADSSYAPADLVWHKIDTGNFNIFIDYSTHEMHVRPVNPFKTGLDSFRLAVSNPSNMFDSAWFFVQTDPVEACKGAPVLLMFEPEEDDTGYAWTANPADPSLIHPDWSSPTVSPQQNTAYQVTIFNDKGNSRSFSVTLNLTPSKLISDSIIYIKFSGGSSIQVNLDAPFYSKVFMFNTPRRITYLNGFDATVDKGSVSGKDTAVFLIMTPGCSSMGRSLITDDTAIGKVSEAEKPMAQIYPNPVGNILNIEIKGTQPTETIARLFTTEGKLLWETKLEEYKNQIRLPDRLKGLYLLKLETPEGSFSTFRLIKE